MPVFISYWLLLLINVTHGNGWGFEWFMSTVGPISVPTDNNKYSEIMILLQFLISLYTISLVWTKEKHWLIILFKRVNLLWNDHSVHVILLRWYVTWMWLIWLVYYVTGSRQNGNVFRTTLMWNKCILL